MLQEFRKFIARGNVVDLAVAVIIGAAFGKIVDSLVKDILTPLLSPLTSGVNFADYKLGPLAIGNFVNNAIQFLIISFALFLIVKAVNSFDKPDGGKAKEAPKEDSATKQVEQNKEIIALLTQITKKM